MIPFPPATVAARIFAASLGGSLFLGLNAKYLTFYHAGASF